MYESCDNKVAFLIVSIALMSGEKGLLSGVIYAVKKGTCENCPCYPFILKSGALLSGDHCNNSVFVRQSGQPIRVPMAVVIQEMVAADCAGVLFTRDPVNGSPERMVINANYGLGEVRKQILQTGA